MPICIMQWHVEIGMFFRKSKVRYRDRILLPTIRPFFVFLRRDSCNNLSVCHWNLNSMAAHNFEKRNLLEVYNTINKFDNICLSESYLDSSIASDNNDLSTKGYKLYRADYPNNIKRDGVHAYIMEWVPVRCLSNTYL